MPISPTRTDTPEVFSLQNAGAPTNGTSGTFAGVAGIGQMLFDSTNGVWYANTNTQASPTWRVVDPHFLVHAQSNTVARTDTTAKAMFTLPAGSVILAVDVYGAVGSDAATTATIVVGKSGTANAYLTSHNVKGAAGVGFYSAPESVPGTIGASAVPVTATYAETGGASTTGGPWTVIIRYTTG